MPWRGRAPRAGPPSGETVAGALAQHGIEQLLPAPLALALDGREALEQLGVDLVRRLSREGWRRRVGGPSRSDGRHFPAGIRRLVESRRRTAGRKLLGHEPESGLG